MRRGAPTRCNEQIVVPSLLVRLFDGMTGCKKMNKFDRGCLYAKEVIHDRHALRVTHYRARLKEAGPRFGELCSHCTVASHFCQALSAAFTQPRARLFAQPFKLPTTICLCHPMAGIYPTLAAAGDRPHSLSVNVKNGGTLSE